MKKCQLLLAALGAVDALQPNGLLRRSSNALVERQSQPAYAAYTIDQPIDHFPHSSRYEPHDNGTFKQRYFFDSSYYKPGGPVFFYLSGETSGESRFSNLQTGIIQILMQEFNGLGVILENRYYGESFPYNSSTTDQLAYLTTEQTLADNAYFAQHAVFPGINTTLTAPDTPWILYGGSLAGAQTAFSVQTYGDILYGGIGSSATTHAVLGYPEWYNPIQNYGPQDCIVRVNRIVEKVDAVFKEGNRATIHHLKSVFNLANLTDDRDFVQTIAFPIGSPTFYPTNTWQELNAFPQYTTDDFFEFCGNVTGFDDDQDVQKIDSSLANYTNGHHWLGLGGYARYVRDVVVPLCTSGNVNNSDCFGTQNVSYWADTTNGASRSYLYSACSEQGTYIQAPPPGGPSLISRLLTTNYTQEWCTYAFPSGLHNAIPSTPELSRYNDYTYPPDNKTFTVPRLALIDGDQDPWLDICYHSHLGQPRRKIEPENAYLITGGGHHWDSYGIKDVAAEPQFIREAHKWEIRTIRRWLDGFDGWQTRRVAKTEL